MITFKNEWLENKQFYEEKAGTCKVVKLDANKAQSQYTTARGLNFKIVGHLFQAAAQHVSVLGLYFSTLCIETPFYCVAFLESSPGCLHDVPNGYPTPTRYPIFFRYPTWFKFENHRVAGTPKFMVLPHNLRKPKVSDITRHFSHSQNDWKFYL